MYTCITQLVVISVQVLMATINSIIVQAVALHYYIRANFRTAFMK